MVIAVPNPKVRLQESEVQFVAIRAQGPGGQNVNKVSSAIQLRFDSATSSLPEEVKARLLKLGDQRISAGGVVTIKAQQHRSQERNRTDALLRLQALIARAAHVPELRRPTRPGKAARKKRVEEKVKRGLVKLMRRPVDAS